MKINVGDIVIYIGNSDNPVWKGPKNKQIRYIVVNPDINPDSENPVAYCQQLTVADYVYCDHNSLQVVCRASYEDVQPTKSINECEGGC